LSEYYKLNFLLTKLHSFSISEIENMLPYERAIYTMLLLDYLEEEKRRKENNNV